MKYKIDGIIKIEYTYYVNDQEVEAENEDAAIEAICEDFLPGDEDHANYDTYGCTVTLIEDELPESELPEDRRMRLLGAPMLPGLEAI